jgi:Tfp pilus assembly protein PilO
VLATRTARWSAATALACVLLMAVTWFLLISPRREQAAETRAAQVTAEQANDVLRTKVEQLRAEFADLPKTRAELAKIKTQMTPTADLSQLVRTVSALSVAAGADLVSITPGAAVQPAGAGGKGGTATAAGVVTIPLSIVVTGDYYQVVGFVRRLQTEMTRAVLISGLQIDKANGGGTNQVQLTVSGDVFSLPENVAAITGSTGTTGTTGSTASNASAGTGSDAPQSLRPVSRSATGSESDPTVQNRPGSARW